MATKKTSVTSNNINKPKENVSTPKTIKKEVEAEDITPESKILIFLESGAGYVTSSGFKFSQSNRIAEIPEDEAKQLLALDNFRLPNDAEKELYYTNQED